MYSVFSVDMVPLCLSWRVVFDLSLYDVGRIKQTDIFVETVCYRTTVESRIVRDNK